MNNLLSSLCIWHINFSKLKLVGAIGMPLNYPNEVNQQILAKADNTMTLTIRFVKELGPCSFVEGPSNADI